jgi:hypothetical protein
VLNLAIFDKLFLSFHKDPKKIKCRHALSHHVYKLQKRCMNINMRVQIEDDTSVGEFAVS